MVIYVDNVLADFTGLGTIKVVQGVAPCLIDLFGLCDGCTEI